MGMHTEIFVNIEMERKPPEDIYLLLKALSDGDYDNPLFENYPNRFKWLFSSGSFYFPSTAVCRLSSFQNLDMDDEPWYFIGKGNIKNYNGEIQEFFKLIEPYAYDPFIGYYRYEEDDKPTIVMKGDL